MAAVWRIFLVTGVLLLGLLLVTQPAAAFSPDPQSGAPQNNGMANSGPYAIGWGTLALINAGLAQGKNRSGLGWFLISILLGPIATFLLVVLFNKKPYTP